MNTEPLVGCVILNYGRSDDTLQCLQSLAAGTYRNYFVIVLDCMPVGDSARFIRSAHPNAEVVELHENLGYAGNNNIGIRAAFHRGAEWVLLLNDDTLLDSELLTYLIDAVSKDATVGIAGPLVYHHDEPTVIQSAGGGLTRQWRAFHFGQNERDVGQFQGPRSVQWISGCAILIKKHVVDAVGGLDERFFAYWEETELCVRASRGGWRILHVPSAKIWHKGVQRNYRPKPQVTYYVTRNHLLMLSTHRAPVFAQLKLWLEILSTLTNWTVRPKWRDKRAHRDAMWRAVRDYLTRHWGPMPG